LYHQVQVRTLVAHEPPVVELLRDAAQLRAQSQGIYDTYRADGADTAMAKFMAHACWPANPASRQMRQAGNLLRSRWPGCAPQPTCSSRT
jgi:hypothetical protein